VLTAQPTEARWAVLRLQDRMAGRNTGSHVGLLGSKLGYFIAVKEAEKDEVFLGSGLRLTGAETG
jgi:hypothetical protein